MNSEPDFRKVPALPGRVTTYEVQVADISIGTVSRGWSLWYIDGYREHYGSRVAAARILIEHTQNGMS